MKVIDGELVATSAELVAAPAVLDLSVGLLSRIPRVDSTPDDEKAVKEFFDSARGEFQALFRAAIATLVDPGRIGTMHFALGEESLRRAILAWGPATGQEAVMMVSRRDGWSIRQTSPEELTDSLASVLLEDVALSPSRIGAALSQEGAFVFLAVLHVLRHGRLRALLSYEPSPVGFNGKAVLEALENAGIEDYRWPLLFFDKVLPFSMNGLTWGKQLEASLRELADRGFVEQVKKQKDVWMLTPLGYQFAVADSQHLTKAGLRITESTEKDLKAHETFLFMRSLQDILMYDLGGREAVITSVTIENLRALLANVLTPPAHVLKPRAADMSVSTPEAGDSCGQCGTRLEPGAKFCPSCGNKTTAAKTARERKGAKTCSKCGAKLNETAKFCANCGMPT